MTSASGINRFGSGHNWFLWAVTNSSVDAAVCSWAGREGSGHCGLSGSAAGEEWSVPGHSGNQPGTVQWPGLYHGSSQDGEQRKASFRIPHLPFSNGLGESLTSWCPYSLIFQRWATQQSQQTYLGYLWRAKPRGKVVAGNLCRGCLLGVTGWVHECKVLLSLSGERGPPLCSAFPPAMSSCP